MQLVSSVPEVDVFVNNSRYQIFSAGINDGGGTWVKVLIQTDLLYVSVNYKDVGFADFSIVDDRGIFNVVIHKLLTDCFLIQK